jgi:hypothetical protein
MESQASILPGGAKEGFQMVNKAKVRELSGRGTVNSVERVVKAREPEHGRAAGVSTKAVIINGIMLSRC